MSSTEEYVTLYSIMVGLVRKKRSQPQVNNHIATIADAFLSIHNLTCFNKVFHFDIRNYVCVKLDGAKNQREKRLCEMILLNKVQYIRSIFSKMKLANNFFTTTNEKMIYMKIIETNAMWVSDNSDMT